MRKYFVFIITFFLLTLTSCISTNKSAVEENIQSAYEYPFYYNKNDYMPIISFPIIDFEGNEVILNLEFDSGQSSSYLTKKGLQKLRIKNFAPKTNQSYTITLDSEHLAYKEFKSVKFLYSLDDFKNSWLSSKTDGKIGFDFFRQLEEGFYRMTIDYKNHKIILNNSQLNVEPITMNKISILGNDFYEIPLLINDLEESAILDTGTQSFGILRKDLGQKRVLLSDDDYLKIPNIKKTDDLYETIDLVKIGNIVVNNAKFCLSTSKRLKCPEIARNLVLNNNTLGFALFKNYTIQFDFGNNLFFME